MKFEIKHNRGYYTLFVNGEFQGNYDTFTEAANEIEEIKLEKESAA